MPRSLTTFVIGIALAARIVIAQPAPKDPRVQKAEAALAEATLAADRAALSRDRLKLALDSAQPSGKAAIQSALDEAEKLVRERERAVAEAKLNIRAAELDARQDALRGQPPAPSQPPTPAPAAQPSPAAPAPAPQPVFRPVTSYPKKYEELLPLAEKGDAVAQCLVGEWLDQGIGVRVDDAEARKWYKRSAEQGYPRGQAMHAQNASPEEKLWLYRAVVAKGDPFGLHLLGMSYWKGDGVIQDKEVGRKLLTQAMRLLEQAAEAGDLSAQHWLAYFLRESPDAVGLEAGAALPAVLRWYRSAAEQEMAAAMDGLGFMYSRGWGVGKDKSEAVKWWRKAAHLNHARAAGKLAESYRYGNGVTQDETQAAQWYRVGAEGGYPPAMEGLAHLLEEGNGVAKNEQESIQWYRKAAGAGSSNAMYVLAFCSSEGSMGVPQSETDATAWFKQAAERGHVRAMVLLAWRYAQGVGINRDESEGSRWMKKAADEGETGAEHALGLFYERGTGVQKSPETAVQWWRKAAVKGHPPAQFSLGDAIWSGNGVQADHEEGRAWILRAARQGYAQAQSSLGYIEETDKNGRKEGIYYWYALAAKTDPDNQSYVSARDNARKRLKSSDVKRIDQEVAEFTPSSWEEILAFEKQDAELALEVREMLEADRQKHQERMRKLDAINDALRQVTTQPPWMPAPRVNLPRQ